MRSSDVIEQTIEALHHGKVILYPTDTVWGLGCDPFDPVAVDRIFDIKMRSKEKAFLLLVSSADMLLRYVEEIPEALMAHIDVSEAPLTVIYQRTKGLPEHILSSDKSIGIRIVQHPFISELITAFDRPLVSTSANTAGHPAQQHYEALEPVIIEKADWIIPKDFEISTGGRPSRIVALNDNGDFNWIR